LDPILIVTKMACTLNFLHCLRFISSYLSLTSCIQTSLLILMITLFYICLSILHFS
jgi:hypothetical protein